LERKHFPAARRIGNGVAVEYPLRMVEKQLEQGEVGAGKDHLLAIAVEKAMADHVQPPLVERQHLTAARMGKTYPAQQCLDPRLQLTRAERFGKVVIGAEFQTDDAVRFVRIGGKHDDWHLRQLLMVAHPATQAKT